MSGTRRLSRALLGVLFGVVLSACVFYAARYVAKTVQAQETAAFYERLRR